MRYASPIVQKEKEKYKSYRTNINGIHRDRREINIREIGCFIHSWIPRYKLLVEENFVYNSLSRRSIYGSICVPSEGLH